MTPESLLEWLAKEDSSLLGECKSEALDQLVSRGFARIVGPVDEPYSRVHVTPAGDAFLETYLARKRWDKEHK